MKKLLNVLPNTITFNNKTVNKFSILAVIVSIIVATSNAISALREIFLASEANANSQNKDTIVEATVLAKEVSNLSSFIAFCKPHVANPSVNLIVRLVTGNSTIQLTEVWTEFKNQYSGITLVRNFWNQVTTILSLHKVAMSSPRILSYVENVTKEETNVDGKIVAILTVNQSSHLSTFEILALETMLLQKFQGTRCIITLVTPEVSRMTSFFGDKTVSNEFTKEVCAQFNNIEKDYGNVTNQWQQINQVLCIYGESNIPQENRSQQLNGVLKHVLTTVPVSRTTPETALA